MSNTQGNNQPQSQQTKRELIAVWFSCGAASAVAAKKTIERYGATHRIKVINTPVKQEDEDNRRFLKDVEKWIGVSVELAINPKFPNCSCVDVWNQRKYMSGVLGAPCTLELKKEARYHWQETNKPDWHVMGFTEDEKKRHDMFVISELPNVIPVLIDEGINKQQCYEIIKKAGIKPPRVYEMGYPNANCIGCVKATSPTYWNHVRKMNPEVFQERAIQSREIGCRLVRVKGKRLFLDELPEDAIGAPMKQMKSFECGIFCEVTN